MRNTINRLVGMALVGCAMHTAAHPGHHVAQNSGSWWQVLGQWLQHIAGSEYHIVVACCAFVISVLVSSVYLRRRGLQKKRSAKPAASAKTTG